MCVTKSLKSLFFQSDRSFPIYLTLSISTIEVVKIVKEILALVVVVKLVLNVVVLVEEGVVLEVVMVAITV